MFNPEKGLKKQTIHYAVKCRIYPTDFQKNFFKRQFGCCRLIYNHVLLRLEKAYKRRRESFSILQAKKFISPLKKTKRYSFLQEVNSQSLQASVFNLGRARDRFFKKEGGYPKFKKKAGRQSFEVPQNFLLNESERRNVFLILPKLKSAIKIKRHRKIRGIIRHIVISMEPDGKYYASLNCRSEEYCVILGSFSKKSVLGPPGLHTPAEGCMGYDLGLADLCVDGDGNKIKAPRFLRKSESKLAKAQKNYSRKKRGSTNKEKARLNIAKKHCKIKHQRRDFTHKQSNKIVNKNQVIYFETLNIKGMMRNHCLAKSVADAMLGELVRQVKYKAKWRNRQLIQIGRFEPSSKLCSNCGAKNNDLKLHHRMWKCNICHALHDRDINAAINIKKIGQGMSEVTPVERLTSVGLLKRWSTSWLGTKEAGSGS